MTPRKTLTAKQKEALVKIRNLSQQRGFPPTIREIATELGISMNATYMRLKQLEAHGAIARSNNVSRSIRVIV